MGSAVIAVLVCVLLDFMNPAQALGGWLGGRGASYRSCAYSSPDHLNIVSKSRGGLSSSKLHHISKMASTHPVNQRGKIHSTKQIRVQKLLACVLRNYPFIMIVIFVTSPALVLPEPAPSKLSHISKIASTHPVEETIYTMWQERDRERA